MLSFVERIRNLESLGDGKSGRMQHEQVVKRVKRVLRRMVEIINACHRRFPNLYYGS